MIFYILFGPYKYIWVVVTDIPCFLGKFGGVVIGLDPSQLLPHCGVT
jgi:hypothetical protein